MPIILDANNILHVTGVLPPEIAGPDIPELIDLILVSRYKHQHITLFCDGSGPRHSRTGQGATSRNSRRSHSAAEHATPDTVSIVHSGPKRSADDLIIEAIEKSTAPTRLTVVSSDHQILAAARRRRCPTLTSELFLSHLAHDHSMRSTRPRSSERKREPVHLDPALLEEAERLLRKESRRSRD
ncbi:MAG TPA: NYN domain-containing protein [Phycisphaerales bacterium]|nr:NYN domain-containing protein [Phycisphaerales bacterium]